MHPRTQATLDKLRREQWFRNVGIHDTEDADVLSSWQEAIESCCSPYWEEIGFEAANQYRSRLIERSPERLSRWNEIADRLRPMTQVLVREKIQVVVEENHLPKVFVDTVDWDILHLCLEAEFADIYPPGFFASQAYWYVSGHFPCGWRGGEFPKGKLVVY